MLSTIFKQYLTAYGCLISINYLHFSSNPTFSISLSIIGLATANESVFVFIDFAI